MGSVWCMWVQCGACVFSEVRVLSEVHVCLVRCNISW